MNLAEAALAAALDGLGIARLLSYLVDDFVQAGSLTRVLEGYEPAPIPASFIYPSQRQAPLKLRVFLDFAVPRLRRRLGDKNTPWSHQDSSHVDKWS